MDGERVPETIAHAAEAIARADGVLVAAGAGMGVDSGLPDFRGDTGFWRAYPPYERLGLRFVQLASPDTFVRDPALAWGFYGHRRALYRLTVPHAGFGVLRRWTEEAAAGGFVVTSNVDGQFQRAGFAPDRIAEVHGTIEVDQCLRGCGTPPWPAEGDVAVDAATMRAEPPLPTCPGCGGLARPNVLLFGDRGWDADRSDAQEERLAAFLRTLAGDRLVVVECGAGTAVPTIRMFGERLVRQRGATLVRINPTEAAVPPGQIAIGSGASTSLLALDAAISHVR